MSYQISNSNEESSSSFNNKPNIHLIIKQKINQKHGKLDDEYDNCDMLKHLYEHQKKAIEELDKHEKCLMNMWCGTGKTRTFTIDLFINNEKTNVIVFPSLGLINQYCNDYTLSNEEPFKTEFEKYKCLAFCSDNDGKLKSKGHIKFTTDENKLNTFLKKKNKQIILVTYQSFEKFINVCIEKNININNLIFDEAHHIVGDKIQNIVFNNNKLDAIVDKTRYYTATPVNKNGVTMYDRNNPENSDCGPLAFEYLYYQAVEDGICKSFETQISLYTQKPTYKNKYQPIFESIIRACLSGKYNYWNILTYHSFVNESEDMNADNSFVKVFASSQNQILVKKLFTRIQNEEFPETKDTYSVENVILKGVHSKTQTRHQIIKDFDQKVEGRIFILSSCGILNEGIDTKWANMGVPINPSQSIVKESQRIGRLVRIPDKGMPPAILLIPCEVDITKYSSMNTPELRDQMIREELSECGNFNTALNVISAFKYQYDPELFEMCLKYPNMYAPKEIKDNFAKQGLIVGDSQGNLLENLKYVCEKEDIELDTESFKDGKDKEILKEIAEQCEKTIEIHTQNHDEPVKYINEGAVDEEPLLLFYCEDDNTYAPITKKDKKQKIKRRTTTPPKKRKPLFSVHTHPDLEVLWKIKESSIDLDKTFCQGILDVDINWNEKKWEENFKLLKKYIIENNKIPNKEDKNNNIKILGCWLGSQKSNYKFNKEGMKIYPKRRKKWEEFIKHDDFKKYFLSDEQQWINSLQELKEYIDTNNKLPPRHRKGQNENDYKLGRWFGHQKDNYSSKKYNMKNPNIVKRWKDFIDKYKKYFISKEEIWENKLKKLKEYIDTNKKRPTSTSKDKDIKNLCSWINTQQETYNGRKKEGNTIMKNPNIRKLWKDFTDEYEKYFITDEDKWYINLQNLKEYIDENKKCPSIGNILRNWSVNQFQNYKKNIYIMKNLKIRKSWEEFIDEYKDYYISNEDKWKCHLKDVKKYININEKIPYQKDKKKDIAFLGKWISTQRSNYKSDCAIMKNPIIGKLWEKFMDEYKKYFISYEEKWAENFKLLKEYINENKKKPAGVLSNWKRTQDEKYKKNKMKPVIKKLWKDFIDEYKEYYISDEDKWKKNLKELIKYIDTNNKLPKKGPGLGYWIGTQKKKYKKKSMIMKNPIIRKLWEDFTNEYQKYLTKSVKKAMTKPKISKKEKSETQTQQKARVKSEISILHQKYKTMNSQTLHKHFKENPQDWIEYHKIAKENDKTFPIDEIPRNKVIKYLENLKGGKPKVVVDLGCGFAEINQHFKDNERFKFTNFDHYSANEFVTVKDIKNTGLPDYSVDIAIGCMSMWGSNCNDYIDEVHRILEYGGTLLICEPYRRWNSVMEDNNGKVENRLVKLLIEKGFNIINIEETKFMFIECRTV